MVAVTLVVWPWAASPFSGSKWLLTGVAAACSVLFLPRDRQGAGAVALAALANLAACALSLALSEGPRPWWTLAGPVLIASFSLSRVPLPWRAVTWAGGLAAGVVLLQALGLDPLRAFAPDVEGARLARYGTLGNPDFVASVLGVTAPLTLVAALHPWKPLTAGSAGVQLLGLALLRSFATVLCLGAALLVVVVAGPRGSDRRRLALALGAGLLVSAVPLAGRSATAALAGRWYLVATAARHVREASWLGHGPGAVALHWPAWEVERWRDRCGADAACVAAHPESRFAGVQEHLHDDWLERVLEGGLLGLLALMALFATAFVAAVRSGTLEGAGVGAGLAALAVRATVDFPLARPADLVFLAVLCGAAARLERADSVDGVGALPPDSAPEGGVP
ncbi:MAG TPA: hypothetical protein VLT82_06085 [Myxococcaceae bacterium]|nr:hypothetical protein [Myxococcaceae bacterium]